MPRFAANLTLLFNEVPFLERFERAARAGFKGVEYLFPYAWDKRELRARLDRWDLVQVLHNMPPGDWDAGERGIACHPDRVEEFRQGVDLAIDYATALGCRQLNCLAGLRPEGFDEAEIRATLVENLRYAAARLERHGIRLLVEAINSRIDMPGFYLDSTAKAVDLIREVGSDNLGYQYDVYHMQIMEGDLGRTLERHLGLIGHVQIADNPGRHEPGTGEINFDFLFRHLDRIGYQGWVSCEYRPRAETEAGLSWLAPWLRQAAGTAPRGPEA